LCGFTYAGLETKTVLLNLECGGFTYAGLRPNTVLLNLECGGFTYAGLQPKTVLLDLECGCSSAWHRMYRPLLQYVLCRPLAIPIDVRWPVLLFGLPNMAHRAAACAPFGLAEDSNAAACAHLGALSYE
jgi:hypothetical protein